jgi:Tfp pilus assembly protein PilV
MKHVGGRTRTPHAGAAAGDRGETLIEILVTIILMGLAVVGILAGTITALRISDANARRTHTGNTAQSFAEELKQPVQGMEYIPCAKPAPSTPHYPAYSGTLPSGATYTATIADIKYVNAIPTGGGVATWTSACTVAAGTDSGLQRITLEVEVANVAGTTTETLTVVKRDARCTIQYSAQYTNSDRGPC